jgi:hypothetical protein
VPSTARVCALRGGTALSGRRMSPSVASACAQSSRSARASACQACASARAHSSSCASVSWAGVSPQGRGRTMLAAPQPRKPPAAAVVFWSSMHSRSVRPAWARRRAWSLARKSNTTLALITTAAGMKKGMKRARVTLGLAALVKACPGRLPSGRCSLQFALAGRGGDGRSQVPILLPRPSSASVGFPSRRRPQQPVAQLDRAPTF